jgi:pyruvate,orthophosphate dikinase
MAAFAEIMVPQVCTLQELVFVRDHVSSIHRQVEKEFGIKVPFKFGTMIEVVRACMRAGRLAEVADFFSFGTNDLTQTVFGLSRDDAGKFLPFYRETGILDLTPSYPSTAQGWAKLSASAWKKGGP